MSDALALPAPTDWRGRARAFTASEQLRRLRPAIAAAIVLLIGVVLWAALSPPDWKPLYGELPDADKAAVAAALTTAGVRSRIDPGSGSVQVPAADVAAARILLAGQGLPKSAAPLDPVGAMPLGLSRAVEAARLKTADELELAASIAAIDGVKHATVHIAAPEPSVFVRERAPATASVFVTLAPGRALGPAQVRAIVWLVASAVPGLTPASVSVVDQSGTLLSGGDGGDAAQLGYQTRLEAMIRERVARVLTPLAGAGHFTAEIAADLDFASQDATSERFDKNGAVLRSETAARAQDNNPPPARGIPGALSNTAPAGASLTATPPPPVAAAPAASSPTNESTNRAWEIGRDVSVTHLGTPKLRRLSVAVVIDKAGIKPADLAELTRLVRGVAGFDASRGDVVEVSARAFASAPADPVAAWYERAPVTQLIPALPLLLALPVAGVVALRLRRKPAALDGSGSTTVDGGTIAPAKPLAIDYQPKLAAARSLAVSDADRASAAVRQMLEAV